MGNDEYAKIARKTDRPMLIFAGCALVSVLLLFGFGVFVAISLLNDRADDTKRELPGTWPTSGSMPVRQVPMPTGEMVVALTRETSSQAICQALPPERWDGLLGGPTLREVQSTGGCHVVTAELDVEATMIRTLPTDSVKKITVAGRDATLRTDQDGVILGVELVRMDGGSGADPVLYIEVESADHRDALEPHKPEEKATALAEALITGLMPPGPKLPKIGENGEIPMQPVDPGPIKDQPLPMISWLLCAELGRALGVPADKAVPHFFASCTLNGVTADYSELSSIIHPSTSIAGLPAQVTDKAVVVQLTSNPAGQSLKFKGPGDLSALAEKAIPPLLGQ